MNLNAEPLGAFEDPACDAEPGIEVADPFTDPDADLGDL